MTVYDQEGRQQALVSADSGRLEEKSERMTAWGNVVVNLPRTGMRLETSEINYDPPASSIWSDSPVVVNHPGGVTSGSGFRSDLNFERFSINDPRGAAYFRPPPQGGP
jgi:LPS export ABC transporter protein LptC